MNCTRPSAASVPGFSRVDSRGVVRKFCPGIAESCLEGGNKNIGLLTTGWANPIRSGTQTNGPTLLLTVRPEDPSM